MESRIKSVKNRINDTKLHPALKKTHPFEWFVTVADGEYVTFVALPGVVRVMAQMIEDGMAPVVVVEADAGVDELVPVCILIPLL